MWKPSPRGAVVVTERKILWRLTKLKKIRYFLTKYIVIIILFHSNSIPIVSSYFVVVLCFYTHKKIKNIIFVINTVARHLILMFTSSKNNQAE